MNKNKLFSAPVVVLSIFSLVMGGAYAFGSGKIKIVMNGESIASDVAPKNVNGRVMVPISTISKALGANVSWDPKSQTVSIKQGIETYNGSRGALGSGSGCVYFMIHACSLW